MKRFFFTILSLFLLFSCSQHDEKYLENDGTEQSNVEDKYFVSEDEAFRIADDFLNAASVRVAGDRTELIGTDKSIDELLTDKEAKETLPSYYIYQRGSSAFVIISATEAAYPILGYSFEGGIDLNNLPCCFKSLLGQYTDEIYYIRTHGIEPSNTVRSMRANMRAENPQGDIKVAPLLGDIKWNQSPYYNAYCPPGTPVGCVATATSMIMRYWEYPKKGKGMHQYTHRTYGKLEASFNHSYNWSEMPKAVLTAPNHEVAQLSYDVAVSVDMNFSPEGSGTLQTKVPIALKRYFGYSYKVENLEKYNYSNSEWNKILTTELEAKRPIQYAGYGSGGGHSFVCDGYALYVDPEKFYDKETYYYHINWGWGGMSNGWFKLEALDPSDLGTGGGTGGGFSRGQQAVVNFMPPVTIKGDDTEPVVEPKPETPPITIFYKKVKAYNSKLLYICYTKFNTLETFSKGNGYESFLKKSIRPDNEKKINYIIRAEVLYPNVEEDKSYAGIWVDWNKDGQFDVDEEKIFSEPIVNQLTGTYQVPTTIKPGSYRLRSIVRKGSMPDPNKSLLYGEIEDYTITLN